MRRAQMVLAVIVYGATPAEVARRMGISSSRAVNEVSMTMSIIRHPSRSFPLRDYLDDDDELVIDGDLRALMRQWRIEETLVPRCAACDALLPPATAWEGRPREYCSNACRQKAYRRRRSAARGQSGDRS